jgi:hypothetical protein
LEPLQNETILHAMANARRSLTDFDASEGIEPALRKAAIFVRKTMTTTRVFPLGIYRLRDDDAAGLASSVKRGDMESDSQKTIWHPNHSHVRGVDFSAAEDLAISAFTTGASALPCKARAMWPAMIRLQEDQYHSLLQWHSSLNDKSTRTVSRVGILEPTTYYVPYQAKELICIRDTMFCWPP